MSQKGAQRFYSIDTTKVFYVKRANRRYLRSVERDFGSEKRRHDSERNRI
jgi:hypothetical protein